MLLNRHELERLDAVISCPVDAAALGHPLGARQLIYRCWHALLSAHLPDPQFADLLLDCYGYPQRSIWDKTDPDDDSVEANEPSPTNELLHVFDQVELDQVLVALEGARRGLSHLRRDRPEARFREDVGAGSATVDPLHKAVEPKSTTGIWLDDEFDRLTGWLRVLHLVTGEQRAKHWPRPNIRTKEQLLQLSRKRDEEGWLNIDASERYLLDCCLAALGSYGTQRARGLVQAEDRDADDLMWDIVYWSNSEDFLSVWEDIFCAGSFRLGVEHSGEMGAARGQMVRRGVYDISPSGQEFHCFPVQAFPSVNAVFAESDLDF